MVKGKEKGNFAFCLLSAASASNEEDFLMGLLPLLFLPSTFRECLFLCCDLLLCCLIAHGESWLLSIWNQHVSKSLTLFMCNHSLVTGGLCKHIYTSGMLERLESNPAILSNPCNSWKTPDNSTIFLVDRNFICRASTTPGWEGL